MMLFENGPGARPALFRPAARLIRADRPEEVAPALAALDAALAGGMWIAGLLSYEAGYALEPRLAPLMPEARRLPLLAFAVTPGPEPEAAASAVLAEAAARAGEARLTPPEPLWDAAAHAAAMARLLGYIAAGDIYQANLTLPMRARAGGPPLALYGALRARQQVGHGAFLALPDLPAILSRSPELFFATGDGGRIETLPMKGTAPRHPDPAEDEALRRSLMQSAKNRAENLMIVDLLRNDLSRICAVGSVKAPELYRVDSYATLHQMVSRVAGQLLPGIGPSLLFPALFPCGSVTGAPKIRAMEIIRELEAGPRGAYCGATGWMAPDGSSAFNVAIRTLTLHEDGEVEMGVGGGIVADSTAEGEYEEALWKARFAHLN